MWPSVEAAFVAFSTPLEGDILWPYLDSKGLLTVGIGCLIEPAERFGNLGWVDPNGVAVPPAEAVRQLQALKARQDLAKFAAQGPAQHGATTIRLTPALVLMLAHTRLASADAAMLRFFPKYAAWPADAQLFAMSVSWAVGNGWPAIFKNCARLLNQSPPAWVLAIEHSPAPGHPGMYAPAAADISTTNNPGIVPRNLQNELCISNAAVVTAHNLDPSVLHWPKSPLTDGTVSPEDARDTIPSPPPEPHRDA